MCAQFGVSSVAPLLSTSPFVLSFLALAIYHMPLWQLHPWQVQGEKSTLMEANLSPCLTKTCQCGAAVWCTLLFARAGWKADWNPRV